jgi:3-hydroxyisobutyrate dehydrogenase-like beta-hydroxyacid dehydrogenase
MCEVCRVIVSICPPEFADEVADEVLASGFRGLFIDANAISPDRVKRMASRLREGGITLVDGGIVGLATMKTGTTWMQLSGESAAEAASYFGSGPLQVEVIAGGIGQASALKMCFAGFNKGSTALLAAVLGAAEQLGVRGDLERQWQRMEGSPAKAVVKLSTAAPKAWRWVPEMREIAATLESAGMPPDFHEGAATIYSRLAGFKDSGKPDYETILQALSAIPEVK